MGSLMFPCKVNQPNKSGALPMIRLWAYQGRLVRLSAGGEPCNGPPKPPEVKVEHAHGTAFRGRRACEFRHEHLVLWLGPGTCTKHHDERLGFHLRDPRRPGEGACLAHELHHLAPRIPGGGHPNVELKHGLGPGTRSGPGTRRHRIAPAIRRHEEHTAPGAREAECRQGGYPFWGSL